MYIQAHITAACLDKRDLEHAKKRPKHANRSIYKEKIKRSIDNEMLYIFAFIRRGLLHWPFASQSSKHICRGLLCLLL
jgi:hypothetical protein